MKIHPDFSDFIAALNNSHVEYVLVGAHIQVLQMQKL